MANSNQLASLAAFLLAAGKGTRLRPLTQHLPKPLVPICGIEMFRYALHLVQGAQAQSVMMNLAGHPVLFRDAITKLPKNTPLSLLIEENGPFGTAGALTHAMDRLRDFSEIMILNADTLIDLDVRKFLDFHHSHPDPATIVVKQQTVSHYTPITLDSKGRVTQIGESGSKENYLFCGIHLWDAPLLEKLPKGHNRDIVTDFYLPKLIQQGKLRAYVTKSLWADLGTPERYLTAQNTLLNLLMGNNLPSWMKNLFLEDSFELTPDPSFHPPVLIGKGVQIGNNCKIGPNVVIGKNCILNDGCIIENAALLPDTIVEKGSKISSSLLWKKVKTPKK